MEKQLKYELMEYSSAQSEAIYLRKPLTVAELKRTYPNLKGVVFEFSDAQLSSRFVTTIRRT